MTSIVFRAASINSKRPVCLNVLICCGRNLRLLTSSSEPPSSQDSDTCQAPEPDGQSAALPSYGNQTSEESDTTTSSLRPPHQTVASLAGRRRAYNAAVSQLRKQYAGERAAKLKAASQAQQDLDLKFAEERVVRVEVKRELSRLRQIAASQNQSELMVTKVSQESF